MDVRRLLVELGGAARRDLLLARGASVSGIRAAVAAGLVQNPVRGTYVVPGTPAPLLAAAALRAHVSCLSACAWWDLRMLRSPDAPHIAVPGERHLRRERLMELGVMGVHRDGDFAPTRLVEPVDVAVDRAAWCTTPLEQLVILDSALNKGRIDPLYPPTLTKGTVARREWLVRTASSGADSVPETVARAVLAAAGFRPRIQEIRERVGHVDIAIGARHVLEIDGWEHHGTKDAFAEDRRRDREIAAARNWALRYTYWDVVRDPRAFGLEVARVTGMRVSKLYEQRLRWMMTMPRGHINRRVPTSRTV